MRGRGPQPGPSRRTLHRETAGHRAVLNVKFRMLAAGLWGGPTWRGSVLDGQRRDWAERESDPEKVAELEAHGNRCTMLARSPREVEADEVRQVTHVERRSGR